MAKGEVFQGLPQWSKGVLAVGGLIIVGFVGYKIYRKIQDNRETADSRKEIDQLKSEATQQKLPATLTPSQITDVANQLFAAVDGFGHNEKAIYANIAKIKNNADMIGVISAFGVREVSTGAYNPIPNTKGTLPVIFRIRLSNEEIKAINGMLAKKGITYRF